MQMPHGWLIEYMENGGISAYSTGLHIPDGALICIGHGLSNLYLTHGAPRSHLLISSLLLSLTPSIILSPISLILSPVSLSVSFSTPHYPTNSSFHPLTPSLLPSDNPWPHHQASILLGSCHGQHRNRDLWAQAGRLAPGALVT